MDPTRAAREDHSVFRTAKEVSMTPRYRAWYTRPAKSVHHKPALTLKSLMMPLLKQQLKSPCQGEQQFAALKNKEYYVQNCQKLQLSFV